MTKERVAKHILERTALAVLRARQGCENIIATARRLWRTFRPRTLTSAWDRRHPAEVHKTRRVNRRHHLIGRMN
jgi:hypothetical protein